jgi:hypothetical protein
MAVSTNVIRAPIGFNDPISEIVVGTNSQTQTHSGLNGDRDEIYELDWDIVNNGAGSALYSITINGSLGTWGYAGELVNAYAALNNALARAPAAGDRLVFNGRIWVKSGRRRQMVGLFASTPSAGTQKAGHSGGGNDSTAGTNVTTIEVVADIADAIGAGSVLRVYRRPA